MKYIKMHLKSCEICMDQDNPNLLIYGKTGTGKSTLAHQLAKSIQHDFMLIENQIVNDNKTFVTCQFKNGIRVESEKKYLNNCIGDVKDLEIKLLKEIKSRKLVDNKEGVVPILIILDELDYILSQCCDNNNLDAIEYKSRPNYLLKVGPSMGIHFIITAQSHSILYPIKVNLLNNQIETTREKSKFTANIKIVL
ncbi:MAG TPA: AAA family ATPase [Clostridiales bacterium]|nr:AAA family ATPase [Clostridiales bacterium]